MAETREGNYEGITNCNVQNRDSKVIKAILRSIFSIKKLIHWEREILADYVMIELIKSRYDWLGHDTLDGLL